MRNSQQGFTLLEVLIAMTILAVATAGISGAVGQSVQQTHALEEKTFAMWVAQNRLAEMHAARLWPQNGEHDDDVTMAGREWKIHTKVSDTANPDMRQIRLAVNPSEDSSVTTGVIMLTGFAGRY